MIQANELRIGNWLWLISKNKYYQIKDGHDIDEGCESEDFKPIPLTEEILLKCGFEQDNDYKHLYAPIYFAFVRNEWILFLHNCSHRHIKYLHQLQNLYFALTESELNVNL